MKLLKRFNGKEFCRNYSHKLHLPGQKKNADIA